VKSYDLETGNIVGFTAGLTMNPIPTPVTDGSMAFLMSGFRCFDLGRAVARVLARSPWRVALIASSSWSHAFLTPKHQLLYPDVDADRALYEKLRAGDYAAWRALPLTSIEQSGQQEMLNWMCLAGAMAELERLPDMTRFVETYVFNSNKCFAAFSERA
jgi:hypothetical protein